MRVIARRTLREFWERHRNAEPVLKAWFAEASTASRDTPQSISTRYRHASFVADNRVTFNVGGNKFRLIVHVNCDYGVVLIKFVGTYEEYDRIDPETV